MIRPLPQVRSPPSQTSKLYQMEETTRMTRRLARSDRVLEQGIFNKLLAVFLLQNCSLIMQNHISFYVVIVVFWIVSLNCLSATLVSMTAMLDYLLLCFYTVVLIQSVDVLLGFLNFKSTHVGSYLDDLYQSGPDSRFLNGGNFSSEILYYSYLFVLNGCISN
jgi:hypothetical protein